MTNKQVRRKIQTAIGEYEELLTLVKKRKLRLFGHVSMSTDLAKTIIQGTVKGQKRQKKRWKDNIKGWTFPAQLGRLKTGQDRKGLLRAHLLCPENLLRLWERIR